MLQTKETTISLSKLKFIWVILLAIAGVALGINLLSITPHPTIPLLNSSIFIQIIAGANILFWGLAVIFMLVKLLDSRPGLIITEQGLRDNTALINAGFIPWSDVEAIETRKMWRQKYVCIIVNNPEDYIQKHTNSLARRNVAKNFKAFRTPIQISAGHLQISLLELLSLLNNQLKEYQAQTESQSHS